MMGKIALALILGLFFVWSLPHRLALRHLLLFFSLLLLARLTPWRSLVEVWRANRWPLALMGICTVWLLVQAVFISDETLWALQELKGQWLKALLALALGILLACASRAGRLARGPVITTALMGVLAVQAVIAVGESVAYWFAHGELLRGLVPLTGGKLEMSFILNILLAALTVDLLFRACHQRRFLQLPLAAVAGAVMLGLTSMYLTNARNGEIGMLFLDVSASLIYCFTTYRQQGARQALRGGALALALFVVLATISYRSDSRWQVFAESAGLGWNIDGQRAWLNSSERHLPQLENGAPVDAANAGTGGATVNASPQPENNAAVDASAYLRIAFIHAGLRLIREYPWGVGYGRNAFSHALRETEEARVGHAHSGWIDLGIGGGIPAVVLWLLFMGSLIGIGGMRYFRRQNPYGLWLFLLASGYMGRMLLDSVNRDHMLQMFPFLVGYLLVMSMRDDQVRNGPNG